MAEQTESLENKLGGMTQYNILVDEEKQRLKNHIQ